MLSGPGHMLYVRSNCIHTLCDIVYSEAACTSPSWGTTHFDTYFCLWLMPTDLKLWDEFFRWTLTSLVEFARRCLRKCHGHRFFRQWSLNEVIIHRSLYNLSWKIMLSYIWHIEKDILYTGYHLRGISLYCLNIKIQSQASIQKGSNL